MMLSNDVGWMKIEKKTKSYSLANFSSRIIVATRCCGGAGGGRAIKLEKPPKESRARI